MNSGVANRLVSDLDREDVRLREGLDRTGVGDLGSAINVRSGGGCGPKLVAVYEENAEVESEGVKILDVLERTGVGDLGSAINVRSGVGCGPKLLIVPETSTGFDRTGEGDGGESLVTAFDSARIGGG